MTSIKTLDAGTQILDATCAPSNICYPQDYSLLNEARTKLEKMIDYFCKAYAIRKSPMYRRIARKDYLDLDKAKKPGAKRIRAAAWVCALRHIKWKGY